MDILLPTMPIYCVLFGNTVQDIEVILFNVSFSQMALPELTANEQSQPEAEFSPEKGAVALPDPAYYP